MSNFDELIQKIEADLPDLVTPDHLVKLGLANHVRLFRIRKSGAIPFLKLSSARILYLKSDVIDWLKKNYTPGQEALDECLSNDSRF